MSFLIDVALPILALMALALSLPYLWALVLPEGIPGLIANGVLSLLGIATGVVGYFMVFYGGLGLPASALVPFLAIWVAKTALAWAPMLVLGLAAQPKRWKEVVW